MQNAKTVEIAKKVPPDGGYGWVIAIAMAVNTFIYVPMMQSSGLIFKDIFSELNLSASQGSLIINLHAAFGMLTGLLNGVLLKFCGYRKIAFLAAILYFSGVTLTSFGRSFRYFIITYGLIASLGLGMCRASYSLALNTYFRKRRSKAMSLTVTITGFGPIIFPQLINFLMTIYAPNGVILIFGAICAHFFATAMLLQPVKWHMKEEVVTVETKNEEEAPCRDLEICDSHLSLNEDNDDQKKTTVLKSIVKFFDLDLLKDPIFVNILIGLALAIFSELNFTILTPFILNEYKLTTGQIATYMSTTGLADIAFRLLAPFIGQYLKKPPRAMFIFTLVILIVMRFVLLMSSNFYMLLFTAVGLGVAKGVRRVYMGLIIPSHVPLNKLPSASGMEMMSNGFCILVGGSILGAVRDVTDNYSYCIVIMNCVTCVPIFLWTLEAVILRKRKRKELQKASEVEENLPLNKI